MDSSRLQRTLLERSSGTRVIRHCWFNLHIAIERQTVVLVGQLLPYINLDSPNWIIDRRIIDGWLLEHLDKEFKEISSNAGEIICNQWQGRLRPRYKQNMYPIASLHWLWVAFNPMDEVMDMLHHVSLDKRDHGFPEQWHGHRYYCGWRVITHFGDNNHSIRD